MAFESFPQEWREWLEELGITSSGEVRVLGPAAVYQMIQELHPEASPGLLAALRDATRRKASKS